MRVGIVCVLAWAFFAAPGFAGVVQIQNNQLYVDGVAQPQLYGAELQYFRLRGGEGRNVPREKVIALWNRALDRMVEAHMNAISFYIPWDFHEYADGRFDFTGTADEDGDGRPDYPSRDLLTFFRLVEAHGIHHILVRPGPYINAEWGFLGFGAVPEWFHKEFPESHMKNAQGLSTKLYDYDNPEFRKYAQRWISELYRQVLSKFIGPGKPVDFIQLDNETNYMWQSLYNHDYSPDAVARYRAFLQTRYKFIDSLVAAYANEGSAAPCDGACTSWDQIQPPTQPGENVAADQDWYRFHDEVIHEYLHFVRRIWEGLGVHEPNVLFTLAESYNATENGLLPNYRFRNDPGVTGMMTVNLYPKTYENDLHPLLNQPFKADHDVKAADEAKDYYLGHREDWAMGPEIQGGWWDGTPVSDEARKQTYLTTIGHGMKALFIYYFNEGENWGWDWARKQVLPYFDALRALPSYQGIPAVALPQDFWKELQSEVDRNVLVGIDAHAAYFQDPTKVAELSFDSPLDRAAQPTERYELVKEIGEKVIAPYGDFLASAVEMTDPVCFVKDVAEHVPSPVAGIDSVKMNSDWAGGLLGYLMQAGINPEIVQWGLSSPDRLNDCKLIITQDNGMLSRSLVIALEARLRAGATILNFLGNTLARGLGVNVRQVGSTGSAAGGAPLVFDSSTGALSFLASSGFPVAHYDLGADRRCTPWIQQGNSVAGYFCQVGAGRFAQIGALFYDGFNSDDYATIEDVPARTAPLRDLLAKIGLVPRLSLVGGGDRAVVFGRSSPDSKRFWLTVKSARLAPVSFRIRMRDAQLGKRYRATDVFTGGSVQLTGAELNQVGLPGSLPANGSTAFYVEELQ